MLAQYDSFLADHIEKYGNAGKGISSYLSSTICDEFIDLMGRKVVQAIVDEVNISKYYSISIDSTPDTSRQDQLSFILRSVNSFGQPVERFLRFIVMTDHTGKSLADIVFQTLKEFDIPISDCCGQSYDNAANMFGQYSGVQTRVKEVNRLAEFVPCCFHSFNLVGSVVAECCLMAVSYFQFLQKVYNFLQAQHTVFTVCSYPQFPLNPWL